MPQHILSGVRPVSIPNGSTTWTFTYNADGIRTQKTDGTTVYKYTYNGSTLTQLDVGSNRLFFVYDGTSPTAVVFNNATYYYVTNLQGDIIAILNGSGTKVVEYTYDAWGNILSTTGTLASTLGVLNPLRYRGYVYDAEAGLYYLQSRYYNPDWGRFINADTFMSTGQGLLSNNMFVYCRNNPVIRIDFNGQRDASYWSFKNDKMGREMLWWYLYGEGEAFPAKKDHAAYLKKNSLLKEQVQAYLFPIAESLSNGTSTTVNTSIPVVIENGEDIIGYQYLHGTNADVGGFAIHDRITKLENGDTIFNMRYTWNDVIDPNPRYASDVAKAAFAQRIPFANPTDYTISISWSDVAILPAGGKSFQNLGFGWLVSSY